MTSSRVASDLAAFLVPIGVVGAVLAGLCAVVAAVAIIRGASGLTGGAVGMWIPAVLISSVAGFANQWIPLIVAGAALIAMLVIGGVVRSIVTAAGFDRPTESEAVATTEEAPAPARPAPARPALAASTSVVPVVPAVTGAVSTLARPNPARVA